MNPEGCFVATFVEKRADRAAKVNAAIGKELIAAPIQFIVHW